MPATLLAYLLEPTHRPGAEGDAPWDEPVALAAPEPIASLVRDAQRFSLAMHGAALLYNLLVAERYERAGLPEPSNGSRAPTERPPTTDVREKGSGPV